MVGIRTRSTYEGGDIITRAEKVGDNRDTPVKGVQTPAFDDKEDPFVNTLFVEDLVSDTLEDVHTFEELRRETPKHFAEYLTKLAVECGATREARAPTSVWGVEVDDYRTASDGFLQPEISLSDDPEIHTRLTDPKNPRRVAEIWKQMTVGKDLDAEQVKRVRGFVEEYADCFALSMREVVPIPGAEHKMDIPTDLEFNTKVRQRPWTPAQKEWGNPVIDEMLEAGIIMPIDPKDAKCVSPTTLVQKAH
ncbi:hypothetical protein B0H10DRAFT_1776543, partial [Mycena sp. CBHHK59/15]